MTLTSAKYTYALVVAALLIGAPASAQQISAHDANPPLSCEDAIATVETSVHGVAGRRALDRVAGCGAKAYVAIARSIVQERSSRDLALLEQLHSTLAITTRGGIFDAVLTIAEDKSASVEARVSAMLVLTRELHRDRVADYPLVVGGLDEHGGAVHGCFSDRLAGDYGRTHLTQSEIERVRRMAFASRQDKTQPADVRSAATCILS